MSLVVDATAAASLVFTTTGGEAVASSSDVACPNGGTCTVACGGSATHECDGMQLDASQATLLTISCVANPNTCNQAKRMTRSSQP